MAQDADHSKKLKEIEERQNKYLARRVEEQAWTTRMVFQYQT